MASEGNFKDIVFNEISQIGKAAADPLRLKILELIVQAPHSVDSISAFLNIGHATASHHLRVLAEHGFAVSEKIGRNVFYRASRSGEEIWGFLLNIFHRSSPVIREAVREFFDNEKCLKISYKELRKKAREEKVLIIDVRPESEFKAGHFPGAVSVPLDTIQERLKDLSADSEIIVYCRGRYCALSHKAAEILNLEGFRALRLQSGVAEWKSEGLPLIPGND